VSGRKKRGKDKGRKPGLPPAGGAKTKERERTEVLPEGRDKEGMDGRSLMGRRERRREGQYWG